jgi:dienelactone hydrolase
MRKPGVVGWVLAAPALIVIGALDETSPVRWCRSLPRRDAAMGPGPPEYLELPGAGHGFDLAGGSDPAGQAWGQPEPVYDEEADAAAYRAIIRFLRRVLG